MRRTKFPILPILLGLMAMVLSITLFTACSSNKPDDFKVVASEGLQTRGIKVQKAGLETIKGKDGQPDTQAIELTASFTKDFDGRFGVQLFKKDGSQLGATMPVKVAAHLGAEQVVSVPLSPDVAKSVKDIDSVRVSFLPPPPPADQSIGEQAKEILNELLE